MSKNNFEFCYIIGKGGFGKVWKIKHKKTNKYYALKEMSKLKIIERKSEYSINFEREILSKLHNPFIVNMYYAFQDSNNLYLVMDYLKGGDLRFHLTRHIHFSEEQSRFFICNLLVALEYIHSQDIIHRDIKPENLVLDENGYTRITDFGIAKKKSDFKKMKGDTSGTPGYMAPEVMRGVVHSFEVDFFAVGIVAYEFMKGKRPYNGKNRKEIKEEMLMKELGIKEEEIPEGWTKESVDFINKLIIRKKENRMGYNGIKEVKEHPWIKYYPWDMILSKTLPSPFIPQNKDNFDLRYCAKTEKIGQETKIRYEEILMDDNYKNIFKDFYFNYEIERKNIIKNDINNKNHKIINQIYYKVNKIPFNQSKIIINNNTKEKFNTINDLVNNNIIKKENKSTKENLFINIFKKQTLKRINDLFEQKLKNNKLNNKSKERSVSNIVSPMNINRSLNSRVDKKYLNISSILSPARSDRIIIRNENIKSNIIYKKSRQKSIIFSPRYNINVKIPTLQNKNEHKNKIIKSSNKCSTLLTKSNSYKMKSVNTAKNCSIKKLISNKNRNSRNILITSNLTTNLIPRKNSIKKKRINISNGSLLDTVSNIKEIKKLKNNKSIIFRNDLSKIKKSNTLNNANVYLMMNNNLDKTFLKDFKLEEKKENNKENIHRNKNKIPIKKKIVNENKIKINESIRNILKNNQKNISLNVSLKELKENKEQKKLEDSNNKENINLNIKNNNNININHKRKISKEKNNEKIIVNKRNRNKTLIFDLDKSKYFINNNSLNSTKNSYIYKYYKNRMNFTFKTLNNNNNSNSLVFSGLVKEGFKTNRNAILSYKQK